MKQQAIHFLAGPGAKGQAALEEMTARYGQQPMSQAQVIVALGGDGFMLQTLHQLIDQGLPVYGMKIGNVGFLMNRYAQDDLDQRLMEARPVRLSPLHMSRNFCFSCALLANNCNWEAKCHGARRRSDFFYQHFVFKNAYRFGVYFAFILFFGV